MCRSGPTGALWSPSRSRDRSIGAPHGGEGLVRGSLRPRVWQRVAAGGSGTHRVGQSRAVAGKAPHTHGTTETYGSGARARSRHRRTRVAAALPRRSCVDSHGRRALPSGGVVLLVPAYGAGAHGTRRLGQQPVQLAAAAREPQGRVGRLCGRPAPGGAVHQGAAPVYRLSGDNQVHMQGLLGRGVPQTDRQAADQQSGAPAKHRTTAPPPPRAQPP